MPLDDLTGRCTQPEETTGGSARLDGMTGDCARLAPGEIIEDLLCDGLRIIARRDGFRYGTDSVLLANFAKAKRGEKIVELCSGTGAVSILLSAKTRAANITGIEIQDCLTCMANRSAELNGLNGKVGFITGDIRNIREYMGAGSADVVVVNPPYLRLGSGTGVRAPGGGPLHGGTPDALICCKPDASIGGPLHGGTPDALICRKPDASIGCPLHGGTPDVSIARYETHCTIADVAGAAAWLLNQGGKLYLVYRPERLADLFCAMRAAQIEPKTIHFVSASPEKPPSLVLVSGVKGAAAGLRYIVDSENRTCDVK